MRRASLLPPLVASALCLAAAGAPAAAQEGHGPAAAQQEALWTRAAAEPYATLPKVGSAGFQHTVRDTKAAFDKGHLRRSFDLDQDARPERTKTFHPFGAVAKVVFEPHQGVAGVIGRLPDGTEVPAEPHPYTGLFRSGAVGLVRLSLADDEDPYIPGVALKLLVDGAPSANVLAIPSFNGQESRDFFLRSPTNVLPGTSDLTGFLQKLTLGFFIRIQRRAVPHPLILSVDRLAATERSGARVEAPRAPFQLELRPAEAHFPADAQGDFRALLAAHVPAGTVIYRLFGRDEGSSTWWYLGQVRTQSPFVASAYGDRELHFVHHEWLKTCPPDTKCSRRGTGAGG